MIAVKYLGTVLNAGKIIDANFYRNILQYKRSNFIDSTILLFRYSGNSTLSQKRPHFYILNNSAKNKPISIIFGELNPEEISHQKIINSPT